MNPLSLFKPITTFVFDVDGVMTDGSLVLLDSGELARTMNTKDGYSLHRAVDAGYRIAVITGGASKWVEKRLNGLGITDVYSKIWDKKEKMEDYLLINELKKEEVLYMGDDTPDIGALQMVGLPTCPVDAMAEVKAICSYISPARGGRGCVRDVIEKVMRLQGKW